MVPVLFKVVQNGVHLLVAARLSSKHADGLLGKLVPCSPPAATVECTLSALSTVSEWASSHQMPPESFPQPVLLLPTALFAGKALCTAVQRVRFRREAAFPQVRCSAVPLRPQTGRPGAMAEDLAIDGGDARMPSVHVPPINTKMDKVF